MRTLLCGVALLAVIATPAVAETPYDRNLEKAAAGIVASKMGDIRGGFSYKQMPQFVVVPEAASPPPASTERPRRQASGDQGDGLAPAVERQVSRTIF
ncbi:hypothetical protein [Mesorhizobium helmanticense]|uniref:Uncharacterized protein n=1 Tax=Mesorhizobium helmanticense TaxID=1776423 RepID=A0A2T4IV52_9HYPH|nr:hypothetical protein [Mesorhizobium helmanticense]PTE09534.1 hypothetical protein C9427_15725 [Mesorhizobium helmanticense]